MPRSSRREFMTVAGAALGGIAVGTQVTAVERTDRFILKTSQKGAPEDLDVVLDLAEIGYAVVEATESAVESSKSAKGYAPDAEPEFTDPSVETQDGGGEPEDDVSYPYQWGKQDLDIERAHETTKGEGTQLAIIDSGVDDSHSDLEVNTDVSEDFTGDSLGAGVPRGGDHGTHVAGIAAAQTSGATGVAGTAPATDLVDYCVFSNFGGMNGALSVVIGAVVQAARDDCDVADRSLEAYPIPRQGRGSFYGGFVNKAMTYANEEGTLLVVAAGNDGVDRQNDNGEQLDLDDDGELDTLDGGGWISLLNEGAQAVSVAATDPIGYAYDLFAGESLDAPENQYVRDTCSNRCGVSVRDNSESLAGIGVTAVWPRHRPVMPTNRQPANIPTQRCGAVGCLAVHAEEEVTYTWLARCRTAAKHSTVPSQAAFPMAAA